MKYLSSTGCKVIAVIAGAAVTGPGITSAAVAATSQGARHAASAAPQCTAAFGQSGWVTAGQANGAAGTIYYPLEFTNLSKQTCTLHGFAGVSAVGSSGSQLGSPAAWSGTPGTVTLAPGATAHATLAYHDAVVGTEPGCDPVKTMTGLRVYPPDQRSATFTPLSLEACSHAGPVYLGLGPIQPGVGTINNG
jgi:hypothetical protein